MPRPIAKLALEDGTVYTGRAFGAPGETIGEVVFNTSLTGYQEVLTDPSYTGQIVTMTYPLIGNYGTTAEDAESDAVRVAGFVVRSLTATPSSFRSGKDLDTYLKDGRVTGIEGIDTRALVRRLRVRGAMTGILSTTELDDASLVAKAKAAPGMEGQDLVRTVVPKAVTKWDQGFGQFADHIMPARKATKHVVAIDYGMKWNILRCLTQVGCDVTVVPGTATAAEVLKHNPDGVFLSNGPGDPAAVGYAIETVKGLLGEEADLRHLPRPSTARPRLRGENLQAQVRPPRGQSARPEPPDRGRGNHHAEPRFRRGPGDVAEKRAPPVTSISTTRPAKACGTNRSPCSACNITPRPRRGRTTVRICLRSLSG